LSNFIPYNKTLKTQVLTTVAEMLKNIELIRFLYPDFSLEKYESYLKEMVPHNYKQLAVFENEICIAVTGF
jgi:hypothetical protein